MWRRRLRRLWRLTGRKHLGTVALLSDESFFGVLAQEFCGKNTDTIDARIPTRWPQRAWKVVLAVGTG